MSVRHRRLSHELTIQSLFSGESEPGVQAQSWQAHNAGDIALIQARSPYSFVSGYAHELFADGRTNLVRFFPLGVRM